MNSKFLLLTFYIFTTILLFGSDNDIKITDTLDYKVYLVYDENNQLTKLILGSCIDGKTDLSFKIESGKLKYLVPANNNHLAPAINMEKGELIDYRFPNCESVSKRKIENHDQILAISESYFISIWLNEQRVEKIYFSNSNDQRSIIIIFRKSLIEDIQILKRGLLIYYMNENHESLDKMSDYAKKDAKKMILLETTPNNK